ncbi:MAG: hypothetical protein C0401_05020 [Anaerolinea sp.]|nr:hypothetical protein [Anaerolinea sp.]
MTPFQFLDFLIVGSISTEFIVDLRGISQNNILGGSALYTAGGMRCWETRIGLVSKVQQNCSNELLAILDKYKIDADGITIVPNSVDDRSFIGYISPDEFVDENPVAFYASKGLPFPKTLIGFSKNSSDMLKFEIANESLFLPENFPQRYLDTTAAHLCPADLSTHIQLSSILQKGSIKTLTIQSGSSYMASTNWDSMPVLMRDITAFISTKSQLSALFRNRTQDIWEMAEYLCGLGCEYLVVNSGLNGQLLFDSNTKRRYQVPAYPSPLIDPTGLKESFCGGFLAGIKKNYDPLEAVLYGNVSASFTGEGTGPFYGVDSLPGLSQSRLKFIRELVKTL